MKCGWRTLFWIACFGLLVQLHPGRAVAAGESSNELMVWILVRDRGLEAAIRRFEVEHPGWRVILSIAGDPTGMDPQKLLSSVAGGSPPDLVYQDRFSVGEWAARDAFEPLDDWIAQSQAQEAQVHRAIEALEADDPAAATAALRAYADMISPLGPSLQRELAEDLAARLAAGESAEAARDDAAQLAALAQGIHPDRFYQACWEEASYTQNGKRSAYAIPNTTDVRALYYNADLLERAGLVDEHGRAKPPADWRELREYANKLTEYDSRGRMTRLGFAPNFGNSWLYLYGWLNGGRFMSDDGRTCTLDDPRIVEALQFMVDVYDDLGGFEKVNAFQSTFQANQFDPFITGQVAMKIDGDLVQGIIADFAPSLRFGVAPPPAPAGKPSVTWSGGFSWAIPRGSANGDMAFELVRFLNADRGWQQRLEVSARYAGSRGQSFIPTLAPLPHINRMSYERYIAGNPDLSPQIQRSVQVMSGLMDISRFRPVTPVGQLLWDEHVRAYDKAVHHALTPVEALARGRASVQRRLDKLYAEPTGFEIHGTVPVVLTCLLLAAGAGGLWLAVRRGTTGRESARGEARAGLWFASPWLVGFVLLIAGPIIASLVLSFCNYDVLHAARFVGLANYHELLFDDPLFWHSLANTAYMLIAVPLGMVVGLGIALLLNREIVAMRAYRTIFYLPTLVPVVASSILWIWVLNPQVGLVNACLRTLGLDNPPSWLQSDSWLFGSKSAIVIMLLWGAGGSMIIWLAGLKGIPAHLYEAARIDGAGPLRRFWNVTVPMLSPYILFNAVIGVIGIMQIFTQAYIMTAGGPNDSTLFYAYYLFNNAFRYFRMGYASAMAWVLFIIILILTLVQMKLAQRWVHYEAA